MTIKTAVIGLGNIATSAHLPVYASMKDVEIVGVVDLNEKQSRRVGKRFGCFNTTDFRQMIDSTKPDVISVCTPPFARLEIIEYAAQQGIGVLCEKPMSTNLTDAGAIVKLVEKPL